MRVEHPTHSQPEKPKSESFKAQLQKAVARPTKPAVSQKPQVQPEKPLASVKQAAARLDAALARSQKAASTFAKQLVERRTHAELHRPEVKAVAEKIAKLLQHPEPERRAAEQRPREVPHVSAPTMPPVQNGTALPVQPVQKSEPLASRIEKLVEHAELLARAEGPALKLSLTEGRAASIEVVRTGRGEVALRIDARSVSDRRALTTQAKAIREALAERGLKVRELRVG